MKASATIHNHFDIAQIDDRLYSAFIEHMGRAIYGGIYEPGHPTANPDGFRTDVLDLVRALNIPLIRYPGGNFVSAYKWEDGIGPKESRPTRLDLAWRSKETNQVGINEFARWSEQAGIDMMLAVNLGTRGIEEARNFVEYCNHPKGSYWSDLRREHGADQPYDVKMWCLGNEMDGPWQIGHMEAKEYGRLADETSKAIKAFNKNIETVVCGSSNDQMKTYPEWERVVLEECYENVEYISLHKYFGNSSHDSLNYFSKIDETGRYIQTVAGIIDFVKAKKRAQNDVYICFDEWNVWYHNREQDHENVQTWDWPEAPALLEEDYNLEDALFVGGLLNEFIRRSDRVKIACIAQLVNVISPIRTINGGPAWAATIYYPYQYASLYGRGTALNVAQSGPTYNTEIAHDVNYLDISAVLSSDKSELTIFAINRSPDEDMDINLSLLGFENIKLIDHKIIGGSATDARKSNTAENPNNIVPRNGSGIGVEGGSLGGKLLPFSYNLIRLAV
ncbi:MAG: alpha-N-arabinofuranosidase [Paracoccaceae bacterium]|jgi:alpha-N-arabinofuranosidase